MYLEAVTFMTIDKHACLYVKTAFLIICYYKQFNFVVEIYNNSTADQSQQASVMGSLRV